MAETRRESCNPGKENLENLNFGKKISTCREILKKYNLKKLLDKIVVLKRESKNFEPLDHSKNGPNSRQETPHCYRLTGMRSPPRGRTSERRMTRNE